MDFRCTNQSKGYLEYIINSGELEEQNKMVYSRAHRIVHSMLSCQKEIKQLWKEGKFVINESDDWGF
ncbi:hypothetical protein [Virgibacillus siamensis]|uniref:hypothetical protein n=1 Tax=Virgibacillus siamensis TaxID=480071 RepID=UPI0009841211|nr:hypothetical protein [Virgibacillus siamensis]